MISTTIHIIAEAVVGLQTEITVFIIAVIVHTFAFGRISIAPKKVPSSQKLKGIPTPSARAEQAPRKESVTPPTDDRSALLALRAAVAKGDLDEALCLLPGAVASWRSGSASGSAMPEPLLQRLLQLAVDQAAVKTLVASLADCGTLVPRTAEILLAACAQRGSSADAQAVADEARARGVELTGPMYCALLKSLGAEQRLQEAMTVFDACPERSTCLRNTLLDMCVSCGDLKAAEKVMREAQAAGETDVITHNTMIKAYLNSGDTKRVRSAIAAMRADGFSPNCVTYNELIDSSVKAGGVDTWSLIEEMEVCGLQPNQITCSILLKSIQRNSKASDVERTMRVLDSMSESMDEVLLSSLCEACIRAGRGDLLAKQLKRQHQERRVQLRGPHTFGSVIRAYGFVGDLRGVWATWNDMRSRQIVPTSITTGCMVEALVVNDSPDAGYSLIRELLNNSQTRPLINVVIYNSVLKGFSQRKQFERVWDMHREMMQENLTLSVTTYNTLVDACARSCDTSRIPGLLEEMRRQQIEPNVITYSTILKGYCQENRLDKAFQLMDEMKQTKDFRPDEIAYNTLLDGCARQGLFDRGMGLLKDMQDAGVSPSNFTLSVLVKLANRSHRVDKAFEFCQDLSRKYRLRLNIHVYNNLMQACVAHQDTSRAVDVLKQAVRERVRPDARTYTILMRGLLAEGQAVQAAGLLRMAFGLPGEGRPIAERNAALQQPGSLQSDVLTEVFTALAGETGKMSMAAQLLKEVRGVPGVKVDSKVLLQLAANSPSHGRH